jgi:hypothetical protein
MRLVFMFVLAISPVYAAGIGGIQVTGQIPCSGYLSPSTADAGVVLQSGGPAMQVRVPAGRASFTLSLRTNCEYRLVAGSVGTPRVEVVSGNISAAAGMGHLTPVALDASIHPAVLGGAAAVVRGQRVSRGGNNLTADNAILIQITVESEGEAVIQLGLELGK